MISYLRIHGEKNLVKYLFANFFLNYQFYSSVCVWFTICLYNVYGYWRVLSYDKCVLSAGHKSNRILGFKQIA